jgi:cell division protein FtsN
MSMKNHKSVKPATTTTKPAKVQPKVQPVAPTPAPAPAPKPDPAVNLLDANFRKYQGVPAV